VRKKPEIKEIKLLDHEISITKTATELPDRSHVGLCSLSLSDNDFGAYQQKIQ